MEWKIGEKVDYGNFSDGEVIEVKQEKIEITILKVKWPNGQEQEIEAKECKKVEE